MSSSEDLVAVWEVPLNTGIHTVEFEHGTATGKRVIRVNNRVSCVRGSDEKERERIELESKLYRIYFF